MDIETLTRSVFTWMSATVQEGTDLALLIAVTRAEDARTEALTASVRSERGELVEIDIEEQPDPFGNRVHLLRGLPVGTLELVYQATGVRRAPVPEVVPTDDVLYLRPSRYCEVDEFAQIVPEVVGEAEGFAAVDRIARWVHEHLEYVPGSSTPADSARTTFLARQGVCRDYAHLTATMLRAAGIPARCVSVFAPGLSPMDFHLVVEALVEREWVVVDATRLAPREAMVRIAHGHDAADTAFMTTLRGDAALTGIQVIATADPFLPWTADEARVALR